MSSRLSFFTPTERAINPITQTNCKGLGVIPDLPVIAVLAFEEAYAIARYSAFKYRVNQGKTKPEENTVLIITRKIMENV